MKKIKLLTVAGSLIMASSLLAPTLAGASDYLSGMNCEAANLTQALQGLGKSQRGVQNNNPNASFFVVCPIDRNTFSSVATNVFVGATFPGSGSVECTVRSQNWLSAAFTISSFTVDSANFTGDPNTGYDFIQFSFPNGGTNSTVVCALGPGEGIQWIGIG